MILGTASLEDSFVVSYKTKHTIFTVWSSNCILGIYQRDWKCVSTQKPAMAALFILKTCRRPRCPSVGELS